MSLLGSINTFLDSADQAEDFRTLLGTGKVWSDRAPDKTAMPYVVVTEISTTPLSLNTTHTQRVDAARVQFDCFARSGALVDQVLDALEDIFSGPERVTLSVSNRSHLTTSFQNRLHVEDPEQDVFHGFVEMAFTLATA